MTRAYLPVAVMEARRNHVANLMQSMQRPTGRRIAAALARMDPPIKVGRVTVQNDIKAVRAEWREARIEDVDDAVARELARIQMVEQEAWTALLASKGRVVTRVDNLTRPRDDDGAVIEGLGQVVISSTETSRVQVADAKYMMVILKCSEMRARLLGLNQDSLEITGRLPTTVTLDIGENTPITGAAPPLQLVPGD